VNQLAKGAIYAEDDEDPFTQGYIERGLEHEKITKEDQQEFDDLW
jgi:hypothetical protein